MKPNWNGYGRKDEAEDEKPWKGPEETFIY